jgi:hypothetical protein
VDRYQQCLQEAEIKEREKKEAAKQWAHKWRDPFTYLDEDETPYTATGSIDIIKAMYKARRLYYQATVHSIELTAILWMYYHALMSNSKVIYLEEVVSEPAPVIQIPRIEIALHPRDCAICATKTSSGIRALCDSCHQRFIIDKNYKNTPLTFDEVASAILRADTRHRAAVQARLAS